MGVSPPFDGIATTWRARRAHWGTRPGTLVWVAPPPAQGDAARAARTAAGVWLFAGHLVTGGGASPWDAAPPDPAWARALHGHDWLDDFAASPDAGVRARLRAWVWDWIARHGRGGGPGWTPGLVASRTRRWIAHGIALLQGAAAAEGTAFLHALAAHARYLDRHWEQAAPGAERIAVLATRVQAGLGLEAGAAGLAPALADLGVAAELWVDAAGGIPSRDAAELLEAVARLDWVRDCVEAAGLTPHPGHLAALARARGALRGALHADGSLPRFHGAPGPDRAEVAAVLGAAPGLGGGAAPLGLCRLAAPGAVLLIDAAPPPPGGLGGLGIEFSTPAGPLIVSGAAPSGLAVAGAAPGPGGIEVQTARDAAGDWLIGQSTALAAQGLVWERRVFLARDGARLAGEDTVLAPDAAARTRMAASLGAEAAFTLAFHIAPDVAVRPALAGRACVLTPARGAPWMLRADGAGLRIQASSLPVAGRLHRRATKLVVVSGRIAEYWGRVGWSLDRLDHAPGAPGAGGV